MQFIYHPSKEKQILVIINQIIAEIGSITKPSDVAEVDDTLKEEEADEIEVLMPIGHSVNSATLLDAQLIGVSIGLTPATLGQQTFKQVPTTIILYFQIKWLSWSYL